MSIWFQGNVNRILGYEFVVGMYGISFHALSDMHTVAIYATRLTFKHILVKMYLSGVFGGLRRTGDIFGSLL